MHFFCRGIRGGWNSWEKREGQPSLIALRPRTLPPAVQVAAAQALAVVRYDVANAVVASGCALGLLFALL